jgi:drug/metabolite transporter (DMT)-like permease
MALEPNPIGRARVHAQRLWRVHVTRRSRRWPVSVRGMLWATLAGITLCALNVASRVLSMNLDVYQAMCMRYIASLVLIVPFLLRLGWAGFKPVSVRGQLLRGVVHTVALSLWFTALADMTALSFTGPIFIMLGAAWFLGEPMRAHRWVAALLGFAGVLVIVGPNLSGEAGWYTLVMLASSPIFAVSILLTKAMTRHDSPKVIVLWQTISVTLFTLPLALLNWRAPTAGQWLVIVCAGALGTSGHYFMTRAFQAVDVSALQSLRFLDLIWASLWGWFLFSEVPMVTTLLGALVILGATVWAARREARLAG